MKFIDRLDAGQQLAKSLLSYREMAVIVYALPRGGVILGTEVARALHAPLDLIIPRKIGHPANPEYAICAVTEHGEPVCNPSEIDSVDSEWLEREISNQRLEAKRRREAYLGTKPPTNPKHKIAIIVDDGIATGLTMIAAIRNIKPKAPTKIVVAIPILPRDILPVLQKESVTIVAVEVTNSYLGAVGAYYQNFEQVEDEEVVNLLH